MVLWNTPTFLTAIPFIIFNLSWKFHHNPSTHFSLWHIVSTIILKKNPFSRWWSRTLTHLYQLFLVSCPTYVENFIKLVVYIFSSCYIQRNRQYWLNQITLISIIDSVSLLWTIWCHSKMIDRIKHILMAPLTVNISDVHTWTKVDVLESHLSQHY